MVLIAFNKVAPEWNLHSAPASLRQGEECYQLPGLLVSIYVRQECDRCLYIISSKHGLHQFERLPLNLEPAHGIFGAPQDISILFGSMGASRSGVHLANRRKAFEVRLWP